MDMKTVFFVLLIGFACAYMYEHRGAVFPKNESVCDEYIQKISQPEYDLSYGERVKAVANGCL